MRVAVTGATGLVGSALVSALRERGDYVLPISRATTDGVAWPTSDASVDKFISAFAAESIDAIVHLAGANIAEKRWTEARKAELRSSRLETLDILCRAIAAVSPKPSALLSASAIGIYGDRGDETLTERSERGNGFLADLTADWESRARAVESLGVRVALLRFGVILSAHGGALRKMLPAFQWGVGGRLGNGNQWMSWISLTDTVRAILFALDHGALLGAVNVVSPTPEQNATFTMALAKTLRKPAFLPVPAFALRLGLGELSSALLSSARVLPERLLAAGFRFEHPTLEAALAAELRK